jgi:hypothetical protein
MVETGKTLREALQILVIRDAIPVPAVGTGVGIGEKASK